MDDRPQRPLITLTAARVREFVREPAVLFWVFGFPVLLAVVLGIAFREQPPEPARAGVDSGHPHSQRLVELLASDNSVMAVRADAVSLEQQLDKGIIDLIVTFEPPAALTFRYDPSRDGSRAAKLLVDTVIQRGLGREDVATISEQTDVPPGSRYIDFLIPGLIGLNLLGSGLWGVGYGLVNQRSRKLLKRFAVTPMRRSDFLLSIMLSRMLFLVIEVVALVAFGWWVFDVGVAGSLLDLAVACLVGGMTFTGIGVLCASRTASTEVANGLINFVTLPMWLVSGAFFPYERFPEALHTLIEALPLTALNNALREIMLEGHGLGAVMGEIAIMAAWGVACFGAGLKLFRWK